MKLEVKKADDLIRTEEFPFDNWSEAISYIQFLFDGKEEAAIMEQRNLEDGRKSACIKDRTRKIIYQLKTIL